MDDLAPTGKLGGEVSLEKSVFFHKRARRLFEKM